MSIRTILHSCTDILQIVWQACKSIKFFLMCIFFQSNEGKFYLIDMNDKNSNKEPVLEISRGNEQHEQE